MRVPRQPGAWRRRSGQRDPCQARRPAQPEDPLPLRVATVLAALLLLLLTGLGGLPNAEAVTFQSDIQSLMLLRNAVTNWDDFARSRRFAGWNSSTSPVPAVCTWGGLTCDGEGNVVQLNWQCDACAVKAQGTLPPDMGRITTLTTLNLQGNQFSGTLPALWGDEDNWPRLQVLFLNFNNLTGTLPPEWGGPSAFPSLLQLRLDSNRLQGSLPDTWGKLETSMAELVTLRLGNNNLSGTIPETWGSRGSFSKLTTLGLDANNLNGTLPRLWADPSVGRFMQELYLRNNSLTGGIPPEWGSPEALPSLRFLYLSNNPLGGLNDTELRGTLPAEWGQVHAMASLDVLQLENNDLSGSIPPEWEQTTQLQRMLLRPGNDRMCGPTPSRLPFDLCDERDLSCTRLPARIPDKDCPPLLPPSPAPAPSPSSSPSPVATGALVVNGRQPGSTSAGGSNGSTPAGVGTSTSSSGGGGGGSSFPVAAVAVPVAVVAAGAAGLGLFVLARRRRRRRRRGGGGGKGGGSGEGEPLALQLSSPLPSDKPSEKPFRPEGFDELDELGYAAAAPFGVVVAPQQQIVSAPATTRRLQEGRGQGALGSVPPAAATAPAAAAAAGPLDQGPLEVVVQSPAGSLSPAPASSAALSSPVALASPAALASPDASSAASALPWSDWVIRPEEIEIMKRPDGRDWELGSGGFGKVYKALRNGVQPVAVKIILPRGDRQWQEEGSAAADCRREIAILRACRDVNILQFHGAHLGPDCTMLVSEFMEGGDLMHNIRAGRVSWYKRGKKVALDVAKGLVFLHSKRVVHMDLKSPNILLSRDGTAKVGDVGMAKIMAMDYVSAVASTLAWSAPEILWGERCTEKVDIYSFGIVLWEICSREVPERGRLRDVRVPEECPPEARTLILDCLQANPRKRPSALQLVERLRAIPDHPPASAAGAAGTAGTAGGAQRPHPSRAPTPPRRGALRGALRRGGGAGAGRGPGTVGAMPAQRDLGEGPSSGFAQTQGSAEAGSSQEGAPGAATAHVAASAGEQFASPAAELAGGGSSVKGISSWPSPPTSPFQLLAGGVTEAPGIAGGGSSGVGGSLGEEGRGSGSTGAGPDLEGGRSAGRAGGYSSRDLAPATPSAGTSGGGGRPGSHEGAAHVELGPASSPEASGGSAGASAGGGRDQGSPEDACQVSSVDPVDALGSW